MFLALFGVIGGLLIVYNKDIDDNHLVNNINDVRQIQLVYNLLYLYINSNPIGKNKGS